MKLTDRERVDGTSVTIGRRVYYRNEENDPSKCYAAEYRDFDGKQVCRSLGTRNRAEARRKAVEIQQELESGVERVPDANLDVKDLIVAYRQAVEAKGVARKTQWKYKADLDKLETYCSEKGIRWAGRFSETDLYGYRAWLKGRGYADKTVEAATVLAKQMLKWAWRQRLLRDYRLAAASFPKARAEPQPCFTSEQVDALIKAADGEEKLACALMGYAGLRIGEVEQLRWEDLHAHGNGFTMIHVRRGGSSGRTKDKDDRFVPVHPTIAALLAAPAKKTGKVFQAIKERHLLQRLKGLCEACSFENPKQYKLHSFRHHFASLCANHRVAYRKALAWLGHSSSQMLDLYYHLHDEDSQQAMMALAESGSRRSGDGEEDPADEGNLRATGQSKIEKTLQVPEVQALVASLSTITERAGFEPAVPVEHTGFRNQLDQPLRHLSGPKPSAPACRRTRSELPPSLYLTSAPRQTEKPPSWGKRRCFEPSDAAGPEALPGIVDLVGDDLLLAGGDLDAEFDRLAVGLGERVGFLRDFPVDPAVEVLHDADLDGALLFAVAHLDLEGLIEPVCAMSSI